MLGDGRYRLFPSRASLLWREAGLIEDLQPELRAMNAAFAAGDLDRALLHRQWQDQLCAEIEAVRRDLRDARRHSCLTGWEDRETGEITFCGIVEPRWSVKVTGPVCILPAGWKVPPARFEGRYPGDLTTTSASEEEEGSRAAEGLYVPVTRKVSPQMRKIGASA